MTAEDWTQEQLKDLYDFQHSLSDYGWQIFWDRKIKEIMSEKIKTDETARAVFTQIIYEVDKMPRKERPTLIMTRPLFELLFKEVLAMLKMTPNKPFFMGNEIKIVDEDTMWWSLGNKYNVEIKERKDADT